MRSLQPPVMISVCLPSDALCNTYCLTWVSLTLDVGYLFTAAPTKAATLSDFECGVAPLGLPVPTQPQLLGLLLPAVPPGLRCGVATPAALR